MNEATATKTLTDDADYLFESAPPVKIPAQWFDALSRMTSIEDESFTLPWNEA